jgi:hypothetical protein
VKLIYLIGEEKYLRTNVNIYAKYLDMMQLIKKNYDKLVNGRINQTKVFQSYHMD